MKISIEKLKESALNIDQQYSAEDETGLKVEKAIDAIILELISRLEISYQHIEFIALNSPIKSEHTKEILDKLSSDIEIDDYIDGIDNIDD